MDSEHGCEPNLVARLFGRAARVEGFDLAPESLPKRSTNTFPRCVRLVHSTQYRRIFEHALRNSDQAFTMLARHNNLGHPRLGLAVSKKCAQKAARRQRIKRLIRESFRIWQPCLPAVDIVVVCRPVVDTMDNRQVFNSLESHWQRICLKCEDCSS